MVSVLIIDNSDSFTYNLVEVLRQTHICSVSVVLLDAIHTVNPEEFDALVISPGPGLPNEKPELFNIINQFSRIKPILGVCLGHQAIASFYGATLFQLNTIIHGEASSVKTNSHTNLFNDLPKDINVGRYHSWAVKSENLPDCFEVIAQTTDGIVMGLKHKLYNIHTVQFHPESVLTPAGSQILTNWLKFYVA